MSRGDFLFCFVALCAVFVPVFVHMFLWIDVEPLSALVLTTLMGGFHWKVFLLVAFYTFGYISVFIGVGALAYFLVRLVPWHLFRVILLVIFLLLPALCSFACIISFGGLRQRFGTYTSWEALLR